MPNQTATDPGLQQALRVFLSGSGGGIGRADEGDQRHGEPVAVLIGSRSGPQTARLYSEGFTSIREFALLPSAKVTRWMIPLGNSGSALSGLRIYVPYAPGARFLSRLLLAITRMGWTGWARNKVLVASRKPLTIESLVSEVTGEPHPVFSLSMGSLGRFQKVTIQAMRSDGEVLGYLKLPLTPEAAERIRREAAMLDDLRKYTSLGAQIPGVLHAGAWGDGYILFQSAGPRCTAPVEFGPVYQDFLNRLWSIEWVEKPGRTIVEQVRARWRQAEPNMDSSWRTLAGVALLTASLELDKLTVRCGITHGDLTPMNSRVSNGQLYLFDWESAKHQAPNSWDIFHFRVQVSSLLHRNRRQIFPLKRHNGERASLLLYLLNSTCDVLEENSPSSGFALDYRQRLLVEVLASA